MQNIKLGSLLTCNKNFLEQGIGRQAMVTEIEGDRVTLKIDGLNFTCYKYEIPFYFIKTECNIAFLDIEIVEEILKARMHVGDIKQVVEMHDPIYFPDYLDIEEMLEILEDVEIRERIQCWVEFQENGYQIFIQDFGEFDEENEIFLNDEYVVNVA